VSVPIELVEHIPIFRAVPRYHLAQAAEVAMTSFEVGEGETLLVEGETDDALLLVIDGELEVIKGQPGIRVAEVGEGELLGDMALFGNTGRRTATVRTLRPCRLVLIEQTGLDILRVHGNNIVPVLEGAALRTLARRLRQMTELIGKVALGTEFERSDQPEGLLSRLTGLFGSSPDPRPAEPAPLATEVLAGSPAFSGVSPALREQLAMGLEVLPVEAGEVLIREGEFGNAAYILGSGQIDVYAATRAQANERVASLAPGAFFGLVSLVHGNVRSATCFAARPSWVLKLSAEHYDDVQVQGSPEGAALRRAVYTELCAALQHSNQHAAMLIGSLLRDPSIGPVERRAFQELVRETV
jgi:CRP/FNR family cyclic AMP-dependent transcriptional regulator